MKKVLLMLTLITLTSCFLETPPLLNKNEYKVIDTTYVSRNGFGNILSYDVIIEIDSSYYAGSLNDDKELKYINPRKLNLKKK
jgi:hypothetical protein